MISPECCRWARLGALVILVCLGGAAIPSREGIAAPYLPGDEAEVLERLPWRPGDGDARADREMRTALATDPRNLEIALTVARAEIANARRRGDPRYLGRAQAALRPWWAEPEPPVAVQLLRATLRQSLHDFDGALADLGGVLARDPTNAQAWLMQAMIEQTRGDYDAATASCRRVIAVAGRSSAVRQTGVACASSVASFTGKAAAASATLARMVEAGTDSDPVLQSWMLGMLADMTARRGRASEARAYFARALRAAPDDTLLLASYADFLLAANDADAVIALLGDDTRVDGLLLRIALAERRNGAPTLSAHVADLTERFAANRLRGDQSHLREEARFRLELLQDPGGALALAERNWTTQREPEDARVVLEAALAVGDQAAADRVVAWVETQQLEDAELARLMGRRDAVDPGRRS